MTSDERPTLVPATALERLTQHGLLRDVSLASDLDLSALAKDDIVTGPITLQRVDLRSLSLKFVEARAPITLEDARVRGTFNLSSLFFKGGLVLRRCRFEGQVDIQWGGHNPPGHPVVIEDCHFEAFVNFFDEWFMGPVIIRRCHFAKGANLLGNKGQPYRASFDEAPILEGNTGQLDLDGG